jgi:hypothetical protein
VLVPGPYETDEAVYGEVGTHDFVRAVLEAIPESDIYTRGGVVGELSGPSGEVVFSRMNARRLQAVIDANVRLVTWLRPKGKNALPEQKYVACTKDLAELVLGSILNFGRFRHLNMLVNYPVYLPGFTLAEPGWNAEFGLYYDRPASLAALQPELDELVIRATLADLIIDFPFDSDSSRQNFFGLMLTPILRPAIAGNTPLHLIGSTIERAGKGKLVEQILGRTVTGKPVPAMQYQQNENDRDKTIVALLLSSATIIHLDNLNSFMDSGSLASLITAAVYRGRVLGVSAMADTVNTFTIVGTGNNVHMSSELVKRTVPIMLRPETDHPEYRTDFTHPDLAAYLTTARPLALGCLLGMVENWRRGGCVPLDAMPLGGFESWVGIVGGCLWTAGFTDWRKGGAEWQARADTEGGDLEALVEAWAAQDSSVMTASEVYSIAEELELFSGLITGKSREATVQRFSSRVLARYEGRPVSDHQITKYPGSRRGKWYLK